MVKIIITILIFSFIHNGFSQERKFKKFIDELTTYKSVSSTEIINDSLVNLDDYELKWIKIVGTYGGSPYCCGGKIIKVNSNRDTLRTEIDQFANPNPLFMDLPTTSSEKIGNQYLVKELKFNEPKATSAPHYIYVKRYYVIKEK